MKEHPILFSGPMVRAINEGIKTQTRRVVKLNESGRVKRGGKQFHIEDPNAILACPYGVQGDRLWVRETWGKCWDESVAYRANFGDKTRLLPNKWKPSIYMPRYVSRIALEVKKVRVERLQDITEEDAIAEGSQISCDQLPSSCRQGCLSERTQFSRIWDSINGKKYPWSSNPLVWVIEFVKMEGR